MACFRQRNFFGVGVGGGGASSPEEPSQITKTQQEYSSEQFSCPAGDSCFDDIDHNDWQRERPVFASGKSTLTSDRCLFSTIGFIVTPCPLCFSRVIDYNARVSTTLMPLATPDRRNATCMSSLE